MQGREEVQRHLRAALDHGADSLNLYNYGLVPAARLEWALNRQPDV
jgi:hypothetical protein